MGEGGSGGLDGVRQFLVASHPHQGGRQPGEVLVGHLRGEFVGVGGEADPFGALLHLVVDVGAEPWPDGLASRQKMSTPVGPMPGNSLRSAAAFSGSRSASMARRLRSPPYFSWTISAMSPRRDAVLSS